MIRELANRVGVAPLGDERDAAGVDVDNQSNVVMAALCSGLVDAHAFDFGQVHACDGRVDVMEDDAPQALVGDLEEALGGDGDGHVHDERHGKRLKHQREAGVLARPWHLDLTHAARLAGDARRTRGEESLMLEEVEMPPRLLDGVVDGAALNLAFGTREARARLEVHFDVEPLLRLIEQ